MDASLFTIDEINDYCNMYNKVNYTMFYTYYTAYREKDAFQSQ